ncbi:MAG TPA: hypothetical protein VFV93_18075, partial [Thermomicrobiales bacterium]|nr:hypothetical protein [Thermomicrobiales bacterium]
MGDPIQGLDRLRSEVLEGRLSRRDVLRRGALLGLSAPVIAGLLAACGSDDDDDDDTPAATNTAASGGTEPTNTAASGAEETKAPEDEATEASSPEATESGGSEPTATTAAEPVGERGGGGNLRLLYWQAPVIMNPHLANGTKDFHASRVCLEPLVDFDKDINPILVLAEEWPS